MALTTKAREERLSKADSNRTVSSQQQKLGGALILNDGLLADAVFNKIRSIKTLPVAMKNISLKGMVAKVDSCDEALVQYLSHSAKQLTLAAFKVTVTHALLLYEFINKVLEAETGVNGEEESKEGAAWDKK